MQAGLAGLQAAIQQPDRIRGVQVTNISLRMLHSSKQSRFQRPAVAMVQRVLRETNVGQVHVRAHHWDLMSGSRCSVRASAGVRTLAHS